MTTVAPDQTGCPPATPQEENVYEFDLSQPEIIEPVDFADLALDIPGLVRPYIGYDGGINKAVKNLDPIKGLLCRLQPYLNMIANDFVELFFGSDTVPAAFTTVTDIQAGGGLTIPLYVSEAWLSYGEVSPCYFKVTRVGGGTAETAKFRFFVDDYEPAGPHKNQSTGYHEDLDAPIFEQHIVDNGVTPEEAGKGVKVTINRYPNRTGLSPRYDRAKRDTIWLLLNGHVVKHEVTEAQATSLLPITLTIYAGKWNEIGSDDVVVQYFIIDEANNRSVAASPVTIIQSWIGDPNPLLGAPFIAEINDEGQIDIDVLGGEPATLVINVPGNGYLKSDEIHVFAQGYTAEGTLVEKEYFGTINSVFINLHIPVPFDDLQHLIGGSLRIRFIRIRAGVTPNRRSRVNVLEVVGSTTPVALPPATILQAPDGNIPADSTTVTVKINAYTGQQAFDAVLLALTGAYPNGAIYYREIGPRPAGTGNVLFNIANGHDGDIAKLEGGTLDVRYWVTNEEGSRPSQIAKFDVGELVPTMPIVTIDEAPPPDHVFDPTQSHFGATVIVPKNAAFTQGSIVTLYFDGSAAGGSWSKQFPITPIWLGKDLYFDVPRPIVVANLNFSARIYYSLIKPGERTRLSHAVDMRVGSALNLPVPEILEATVVVPEESATLNPLHVLNERSVFTIRVRYNMLNSDTIQPYFRGTSDWGSPAVSPKSGNASIGFVDFEIHNRAIAANLSQHVEVDYTVTRGTSTIPSKTLRLEVQPLPSSSTNVVSVPEAVGGEFDTHKSNTVQILEYPFMQAKQAIWVDLHGENDFELVTGRGVSIPEANAKKIVEPIPLAYQLSLSEGTTLDVKARVSLDGTNFISSAVPLNVPRYNVKRATGVVRTIAVGTNPRNIAFSADGSRAYVTNLGGHTVSVINTETFTVIATIGGFSQPYRLTLHPDGTRLFVGNLGTKTMSVVNLATNTIAQTITGFNRIYGIAFNEDGSKVYASCNYDAFVYVHNAQTGARLNSLKVIYPAGLAFNPEYTRLYAPSQSVMTMINPAGNGSLIGDVPGTSYPVDIAFSPHNFHAPKAYITNPGLNGVPNTVLVFDSTTNTFVKTLTGFDEPRGVAMHPIEERGYISEGSGGKVAILNTATDTIVGNVSGLSRPEGMAVTANGAFLWVCEVNAHRVAVIAL
ncbi:YncE family protein [Pseudomonas palleroniana]